MNPSFSLPTLSIPALEHPEIAPLITAERIGPRDGAGKTCVVAMSGGVDSAVTALLMRERGYRVVGINLRLFSPDDPDHRANPCCGIPAMDDARATCARIGVPFYAINMEGEFREAVVQRFVDEYAAGRTPNPCLECNRHVKFRHLVERAKMIGADCLATGHYARVIAGDAAIGEPHRLLRAVDPRKDQSYVLYTLNQEQLGFIQFPLGGLHKTETRQLAHAFELPVADKAESQEICFVGNQSYAQFVAKRRPDVTVPGEVVDTAGAVIGEHKGLVHHTVGQRRGLGIARQDPLFVIRLEPATNRVVAGTREEAAARSIEVDAVSLISGVWPDASFSAEAMVRYRGAPVPATIEPGEPGSRELTVRFAGAGPVASPGQALVLYRGEEVLGGGTIRAVATSSPA
ncbi:MAG: tRNA 2-thiouridine(34) synthase MnmA [Thermomicrobiales bacterium]